MLIALTLVCVRAPAVFAQAEDPAARLGEARALLNAGNPAAAIAKLQALPAPRDPRAAQLLGVAFYHANDYARAIAELSPVVEQLPADSVERAKRSRSWGWRATSPAISPKAIPLLEQTRAGPRPTPSSPTSSAWLTCRRAGSPRPAPRSPGCSASHPIPPPPTSSPRR